ncbi:oxygen-insensitive NAD(P)H nitroreductase [Rubrivivax gelatinosus]|uniref:NAD(P)H nitroreductase n=1 Tax=Rubrivivax gelatinosus TaxID=28068 RepID=A0ABS1E096_RUBGE|nr:oxygen-insensitive NAD(P)H nitroreductase [Rubrivivax gelatinosus]MBK1715203.1 NAD(P)H nitroreductase [Rubrivivax gelatinosus]
MSLAPAAVTELMLQRHTAKAFDPTFSLDAEQRQAIDDLLRLAPSSTNTQPWHFVVAESAEGRQRIAEAMAGPYAYNVPKTTQAALVVVIAARTGVDDAYLEALLAQEQQDGRFVSDQARNGQHQSRRGYHQLHRELGDAPLWFQKQAYIALGTLLLGASALGLDACPMEGFDGARLDELLGLHEQGLASQIVVGLGRRSDADFNAALPKSRWPAERVLTRI